MQEYNAEWWLLHVPNCLCFRTAFTVSRDRASCKLIYLSAKQPELYVLSCCICLGNLSCIQSEKTSKPGLGPAKSSLLLANPHMMCYISSSSAAAHFAYAPSLLRLTSMRWLCSASSCSKGCSHAMDMPDLGTDS